MKIGAILIPCSKSKVATPALRATAAGLLSGDQGIVEASWLQRLGELPTAHCAGELYTGDGYRYGAHAAQMTSAPLFIVSAGLGLIHADKLVPTYGITVSGKGPESVRSRITGRFDVMRWWRAVANGPYAVPLRGVLEQTEGMVLVALSGPYLKMVSEDLEALPDDSLSRLRIIGASIEGVLSRRFADCSIYTDYTRVDRDVPGNRYTRVQRALLHYVKRRMPASVQVGGDVPSPTKIETSNRFIFLLDSGAFTVWRKGKVIGIEKYAEFVHSHRRYFRAGAFNLDVIGSDQKSYENWIELRRLGIETIPVHHFGDDDRFLKKYMDACEFVALGGMAKQHAKARLACLEYLWKNFLLDGNRPRLRIHGLGITDDSIMLRYPWYSVDSSSAGTTANLGSIMLPRIRGGIPDYSSLYNMYLSQRRVHGVGDPACFYSQSPRIRCEIVDFVRANGHDLCEEWRGDADAEQMEGSGSNLTTGWQHRYAWNLLMVSRLEQLYRERGILLRIYDAFNAHSMLGVAARMTSRPGIARHLISYANLTTSRILLDMIEACAAPR